MFFQPGHSHATKKSSRITSFNGLAVLAYLSLGKKGRHSGERGKKMWLVEWLNVSTRILGENEEPSRIVGASRYDLYASERMKGREIRLKTRLLSGAVLKLARWLAAAAGLKSAADGTGNFPSKAFGRSSFPHPLEYCQGRSRRTLDNTVSSETAN